MRMRFLFAPRRPSPPANRRSLLCLALASLLGAASPLPAANVNWTGTTDNDWDTAANWSGGTPGPANDIYINTINLGNTTIANTTAAASNKATIGQSASQTGAVDVKDSATWAVTGDLTVGENGKGTLTIADSGQVSSGGIISIGNATANPTSSNGTVIISGGKLTATSFLFVGRALGSTGTLSISGDARVKSGGGYIAYNGSTSNGTVTVANTAEWDAGATLQVGNNGTATLELKNSAKVSTTGDVQVGYGATGSGTVTVGDTGELTAGGLFNVGGSGTGTLTINGGKVTVNGAGNSSIGGISNNGAAAGNGTVIVNGGLLKYTGPLYVGLSGTGTLTLQGTGKMETGSVYLGNSAAVGQGIVTVKGNAVWTSTANLYIGAYSDGRLTITGNGQVTCLNAYIGYNAANSNGTVTVSGNGFWSVTSGLSVNSANPNAANKLSIVESGSVSVGGAYAQNAGSTLSLGLTASRTAAYLTAASASLGGTLEITGAGNLDFAKASQVAAAPKVLLLHTTGLITNDFAAKTLTGGPDCLVFTTSIDNGSAGGKDYNLAFGLAWNIAGAGTATTGTAHGTFTVAGGKTFEVDAALADHAGATGLWDGQSLTKTGDGTLVLSAANTFSGGVTIDEGTLQTLHASAVANATSLAIGAGGTLDLFDSDTPQTLALTAASASVLGTISFTLGQDAGGDATADQIASGNAAATLNLANGTLLIDGFTDNGATASDFANASADAYGKTYTLFSGFNAITGYDTVAIDGYDKLHYSAALSRDGVLSFTAVPEPATWAMLAGGLGVLAVAMRRRKART